MSPLLKLTCYSFQYRHNHPIKFFTRIFIGLFMFPFCLANPCFTSPCQNGATCLVSGFNYVCRCPSVWMGPTCSTCKYIKPRDSVTYHTLVLWWFSTMFTYHCGEIDGKEIPFPLMLLICFTVSFIMICVLRINELHNFTNKEWFR